MNYPPNKRVKESPQTGFHRVQIGEDTYSRLDFLAESFFPTERPGVRVSRFLREISKLDVDSWDEIIEEYEIDELKPNY